MVEWCCVKGCVNNTGRTKNPSVRFFRFPAWKKTFGPQMEDISRRRRLAWVSAVKRKDITFDHIAPHLRVCSLHFHKGKPAYEMMESDPDWAPCLRLSGTYDETDERMTPWEQMRHDMMLEEAEREIQWEQLEDEEDEDKDGDDGSGGGLYDEASGKPSYEMFDTHPDWAPSLHLGHTEVKPSDQDRYDRLRQRNFNNAANMPVKEDPMETMTTPKEEEVETIIVGGPQNVVDKTPVVECDNCVQKTAEVKRLVEEIQTMKADWMNECKLCGMRRSEINRLMDENRVLKLELQRWKLEEQFLKGDNEKGDSEKVRYYTGLPGFEALMTLLNLIAQFLPKNFKAMSNFQMFFMTLIRLRLNLPIQHINHLFRRDRNVTVAIFNDTVSALYAHCSHLVKWPSREEIQASLPPKFKEDFEGRVAIYLDSFEITLTALCKQPNLKYLVTYTTKGHVTFISKGFEASVSDEEMIEKSGILENLLPGDYIVADQCFVLQNEGLKVVPKKSSVSKIFSRQKVYVKRMTINLRSKYTILSTPALPSMLTKAEGEEVTLLDKIVKVCCALRNMSEPTETNRPETTEATSSTE